MNRLEPGIVAPDFTLLNQDEEPVTLSTLRGNPVVLYFYPEAATPACTNQACDFRDNQSSFLASGYTVLGISPDLPGALASFARDENLQFTLLSDPDHAALEPYGAWGEKQNYGRTYQGVIRSTFIIDETGVITHALYNVRATGHVNRVKKLISLN